MYWNHIRRKLLLVIICITVSIPVWSLGLRSGGEAYPKEQAGPTVTINQAAGQNDPEPSVNQARFTAVFSEPVTGFETGDVTIGGATGATTATVTEVAPNNGTTFEVIVSDLTIGGVVIVDIPANVANAVNGGLGNEVSTSTDNWVTVGTEIRVSGASVENANGIYTTQGHHNDRDYYSNGTWDLFYYVGANSVWVINDGLNPTSFLYVRLGNSDFSPTQTNWLAQAGGGGGTPPTLEILLPDRPSQPTVTINQASDQNDPEATVNQARFTAVFSEAITGFETGDVQIKGETGATTATVAEITPNDGTTYQITVSGLERGGVVLLNIPADVATAVNGGLTNVASTSTDNRVTVGTEIRVSGAGVESANGVYSTQGHYNDRDHYSNGTWDLFYFSGTGASWVINDGLNPNSFLYVKLGNTDYSPTETNWMAHGGEGGTPPTLEILLPDRPAQPTVTVNQASDQNDPEVTVNQARFTAVFSEAVTGFETGDVLIRGETGATTATVAEIAPNDGTTYQITVSGLERGGVVFLNIPDNVATAVNGGLTNVASTSTDNMVTVGTEVRVTGADAGAANGIYTRQGLFNDRDHYSNGTAHLFYFLGSGATWVINDELNNIGFLYIESQTTDPSPSESNWLALSGTSVAPTLELLLPDRPKQPTVTINQAGNQNDPEIAVNKARFIAVFSEAVTNFETGDVDIGGATGATTATVTEIAPNDGTTYEVTVSGLSIGGAVLVNIPPDVATSVSNGLSNVHSTSNDNRVTVGNKIRVSGAGVASADGIYTAQGHYNDRDRYFNGTWDLFYYVGGGSVWVINDGLNPTSFLYVRLGNNDPSPTQTNWLAQAGGGGGVPPTLELLLPQLAVSINSTTTGATNAANFDISIEFSHDVSDFIASDIVVNNGTLSGFSGSGSSYTATVTPQSEGQVTVDINANVATNADGLKNVATQFSIVSDKTAPVPSITTTAGTATNGAFGMTITFSEEVVDFSLADVTVTNGIASNFAGSGSTYTATITPSAEGTVAVDVGAAVAQDAAGNDNAAATQLSIEYDTSAPTVSIMSNSNTLVSGAFDITITFSEPVTGFDQSDITVGNGSAGSFSGSGTTYAATITPSADGSVTIDIAANAAQDAALNGNTVATQFSITNDETRPTAAITTQAGDPVKGAFDITITFSEDVNNFTIADLTLSNGSAGSFAGSGSVYTATVTPVADGAVTVDLAAAVAQDAVGNENLAAVQLSRENDETAPTVSITSVVNGATNSAFNIAVTFSEDVSGFTLAGLLLSNGVASNFLGSGREYTATITPTVDGTVTVDVNSNVAQDAAANPNTAGAQFSIEYDLTAPTVVISSAVTDYTSGAFDVTITFSEEVTGFDSGDLNVGNGSLSNFTGSGAVYSSTITPSAHGLMVSLEVNSGIAQDLAGNVNTASNQLTVTNDEVIPTAIISTSYNDPVNGTFVVTVAFSEAVTGFDASDLSLINGVVDNISNLNNSYSVTITPHLDGLVIVNLDSDKVQDLAGNGNAAAAQFSITNDISNPEVNISSTAHDPVNGAFDVTFSFNEAVTDFEVSDITVENGVAGNFSGTGTTYTATITPSADGKVIVYVRSFRAVDAALNGNIASARFSVTNDQTMPTVTITSTASDPINGAFDITVTFSEAVTNFGLADLVVTNSNASNLTGSGAVYIATITPAADGTVTVDVPAAVAQDLAGNANTAALQFSIQADITAPAAPVVSGISDDTGSDAADGVTNDKTLIFNGTAEANSTVEVFIDGISNGTTIADGSGNWILDHSATTLVDGSYNLTAKATDAVGNTSGLSTAFNVNIDSAVPLKPVILSISEDRGISAADGITNDSELTFRGTAEPFSTIELSFASNNRVFTTTTTDLNGDWAAVFNRSLADRSRDLLAAAIDAAGNTSVESDIYVFVVDTSEPEVSSLNRADANPTMASTVDFTVTFNEEVYGLSTGNFALVFTDTQNASIASISASSGTSITVTVNNITGSGSFGLNLSDVTGITDAAGNSLAGTFTGEVYNTNFIPTDISLSASNILENNAVADVVATLSTADADAGDTHAYSLVAGTGDTDNASFTITGNELKAAEVFDLETKASYNIRLKTDDGRGGTFEKAFTITIDNVPEADMRITGDLNIPATPLGITTTFDITIHNDGDAALTVSSILYPTAFGGPVSGISIAPAGSQVVTLSFTPPAAQTYTGDITINSNGGTGILAVSADGAIITSLDNGQLKAESINLYPNPATDIVTIDLSRYNGRALDIQLYDMSGIRTFGINHYKESVMKLDVSAYHNGLYLVQLTDGKSTVQKKIMIRK